MRQEVYTQDLDLDKVLKKGSYCIDYVNGEKLDYASLWKTILTVSFTLLGSLLYNVAFCC